MYYIFWFGVSVRTLFGRKYVVVVYVTKTMVLGFICSGGAIIMHRRRVVKTMPL
jgi:hypothetical protein